MMDKKRREHIRRVAEGIERDGMKHYRIPFDELRALLDMADERDRYRALLEEARSDLVNRAEMYRHHPSEAVRAHYSSPQGETIIPISDGVLARIDAALEGKTNE